MSKLKVLTTRELAKRWEGHIVQGTIENWRQIGFGPKYEKKGKEKLARIHYKLSDIKKFEKKYFKRRLNG